MIYDNGLEFNLHFETLCNSYGIKRKPTTIKNPQANAICEHIHQVLGTMVHTSEIDMAKSVEPADIDTFIDNAARAIHSTYHIVLKASPGAAIFGHDMLFDIPFIADWKQIREFRQRQTDLGNKRENKTRVDYNYKVGGKILTPQGRYTSQSRVYLEERTMDYNNSTYKWNYQDSMRNQIRKNQYLESNTI